eukprot:10332847-Alexandrium_andersonii.AAC.1
MRRRGAVGLVLKTRAWRAAPRTARKTSRGAPPRGPARSSREGRGRPASSQAPAGQLRLATA